ncbi:MAG TPA: hypothetical protein VF415_10630, partial [Rhodanobacter sp.]
AAGLRGAWAQAAKPSISVVAAVKCRIRLNPQRLLRTLTTICLSVRLPTKPRPCPYPRRLDDKLSLRRQTSAGISTTPCHSSPSGSTTSPRR